MSERLRDKAVKALLPPPSGNKLYYERDKGLRSARHGGRARAFVVEYRAAGRERRYTIGSFPIGASGGAQGGCRAEATHRPRRSPDRRAPRRTRRTNCRRLIDRFAADYLPKKPRARAEIIWRCLKTLCGRNSVK